MVFERPQEQPLDEQYKQLQESDNVAPEQLTILFDTAKSVKDKTTGAFKFVRDKSKLAKETIAKTGKNIAISTINTGKLFTERVAETSELLTERVAETSELLTERVNETGEILTGAVAEASRIVKLRATQTGQSLSQTGQSMLSSISNTINQFAYRPEDHQLHPGVQSTLDLFIPNEIKCDKIIELDKYAKCVNDEIDKILIILIEMLKKDYYDDVEKNNAYKKTLAISRERINTFKIRANEILKQFTEFINKLKDIDQIGSEISEFLNYTNKKLYLDEIRFSEYEMVLNLDILRFRSFLNTIINSHDILKILDHILNSDNIEEKTKELIEKDITK